MLAWLRELDELLRGRKTTEEALGEGTGHLRLEAFMWTSIALGLVYGVCMGLFAVANHAGTERWLQLLATTLKVPALFCFTLIVTFPSLYVFSALLGVRLGPVDTLRLLVAAIAVNMAVLASFGPITAFFTVSTTSYHFMKLLNVVFFAVAGMIGLGFLLSVLRRLEAAQAEEAAPAKVVSPTGAAGDEAEGAEPQGEPAPKLMPWPPPPRPMRARTVFRIWIVIYAVVGAQMGWILRPFIGDPGLAKQGFVLFRGREANIFIDFFQNLGKLLGG